MTGKSATTRNVTTVENGFRPLFLTATYITIANSFLLQAHTAPHSFKVQAMRSNFRRFPLWVLLSIPVYLASTLALPAPAPTQSYTFNPSVYPPLDKPRIYKARADADFVTMYEQMEDPHQTQAATDGEPRLAPIPEVFMAMTRGLKTSMTGSAHPSPTEHAIVSQAAKSMPISSTKSINYATMPPMHGPGLVIPSTPVQDAATSTSAASSKTSDSASVAATRAQVHSRKILVLGAVIGTVAFVTLVFFFLLDPRIVRRVCGKRVDKNNRKRAPINAKATWKNSVAFIHDGVFSVKSEKGYVSSTRSGDAIIDVAPDTILSKFSVCSSSQYPSSRDSSATGSSSCLSATACAPSPTAPTTPVRPPRPPTADSPALSDSVYLACADQPYIVVSPLSIVKTDLENSEMHPRPITPSGKVREFLVNHVHTPSEPMMITHENLLDAKSISPAPKEDSRHSRAHSAPMPMFVGSKKFRQQTEDEEGDSDVPDMVLHRMLKHRRSRSASGWAYPDRPRSRMHRI
ncbi:hypothetical protein B0H34DRAFT_675810 [Crassisporium funariophilum]|nr:hypothetical protein B0H34DRAFT_675810 [Crassisporium funariophilum]